MKNETVLYGVKIGDEDWQTVILSTRPETFAKVREMATRDGFDGFREVTIDLSQPPNFGKRLVRI